ncbi:MAG: prepilin peptidase [Anaerolineales bacterium]|jgi:leader peptidase (prepilin peptidase)/N-methyltransferase
MTNILILISIGVLGWFVGILVNYLSDILPIKRRLGAPICVACHDPMTITNYFFWPRRCPECWSRRPWRTWIVEIFYIAVSMFFWLNPPYLLDFWPGLILLGFFGVVFVIDMEHRLILHPVSIFGALMGLILGVSMRGVWMTLLGGVVGYGVMYGLYWFGDIFARWLARRRGQVLTEVALGFGDVNLAGIMGLLLGFPGIVAGLLLAIIIGGVISILYMLIMVILRRFHAFMAIPYGPFMVISAILLLYFQFPG